MKICDSSCYAGIRQNTQQWRTPIGILRRTLGVSLVTRDVCLRYPLAEAISSNAFTGAMATWATLLSGYPPGKNPPASARNQPIDPEAVERLRRSRAFSGSARLHIEEFRGGKGWKVDDGAVQFDMDYLDTPPPSYNRWKDGSPPHESRWVCPAVQAGGLALYVARTMVPDIIMTARNVVPGQHFRVDYPPGAS